MRATVSLARLAVTLRIKSVYTAGKHTLCARPKCREGYGALRGRRDTDAARRSTDTLGILLTGRGERQRARGFIFLPGLFPVFYRYASWIYSAWRTFAEEAADASISKDVPFYYNQPSSLGLQTMKSVQNIRNAYFVMFCQIFFYKILMYYQIITKLK